MEQKVLRQQSESRSEGRDRQLFGVHTVPQNSSECIDERSPSSGPRAIGNDSDRVGLSGAYCSLDNENIQR